MVRQGGFSLRIHVDRRPATEQVINGADVALATVGAAFEVVITNSNRGDYLVRLSVDGVEVDPGYLKRLRGEDEAVFRGYASGRDVHEFLFSKTPVGESTARPRAEGLGEVTALIFATRRVRLESSSDEDEDVGRASSDALGVRALPEKMAVKEFGVQARAGGAVERLPKYKRRRRGDYRLERIKPEVATLKLLYRDSFWFARHGDSSTSTPRPGAPASAPIKHEEAETKVAISSHERLASSVSNAADMKPDAMPIRRRAPGETARGLDGKRRKLARPEGDADVIELSD